MADAPLRLGDLTGYKARPLWGRVIHPALSKHRFATLICHRRFGKTVGGLYQMLLMALANALTSPQYYYVAPFRTQAKLIAWEYLKAFVYKIPQTKIREVDLSVELPTRHPGRAGARIFVTGADRPDALRGAYADGMILDEFGQMRREFFGEVVRPAIADRHGWVWKLGTPRGHDALYESYVIDRDDPSRFACLYTVDDSGIIPAEELAEMRKDMTDAAWRQEMYCDFEASASNVLITLDLCSAARAKVYAAGDIYTAPRVIGIDVARYGDDRSVITKRQGLVVFPQLVFSGLSNMELADVAAREIREFNPQAVFVDLGRGEGVIDRLRQLGFNAVMEADFGRRADEPDKYLNKRAESWDRVRKWLVSGGSLPEACDELCEELTMPTYSFDTVDRMVLERKDKIKERIGKSPDLADSLAITFYNEINADAPGFTDIGISGRVALPDWGFDY